MTYKVLIVDDSKLARMAVIKSLKTLYPEWTRVEAANAEEALASIQQAHPDVALVDFNMPGQNGLDLAEEIRRANPRMPVAVISANRQREILDRARAIDVSFLAKPLTDDALASFLSVALQALSKPR